MLNDFIDREELTDILLDMNPNKNLFTWKNNKHMTRIDYVFISQHLANKISQANIVPSIHSDHLFIHLNIIFNEIKERGKGFWKFPAYLLKDIEYIEKIKAIIKEFSDEKEVVDYLSHWENLKFNIRTELFNK